MSSFKPFSFLSTKSRRRKNIPFVYYLLDKNKRQELLRKISFSKRQKFVISVGILSLGLFFSEHFLAQFGVFMLLFLATLTSVLYYLSMRTDLKGNFTPRVLILPFFFTLSFGLFYFLVPSRFLTRIFTASLFAIGLYSLFLSHNIFIVASIRTIALLSSARIVSFVLTVISFFFLSNIVFSLHTSVFITVAIVFLYSFLLLTHSLWTYSLDKPLSQSITWTILLALCITEITLVLWFWPSSPTVIALFLTSLFYATAGLSHVWFDKRLFRGVLWEYAWVGLISFLVLLVFTSWR